MKYKVVRLSLCRVDLASDYVMEEDGLTIDQFYVRLGVGLGC